MYEELPATAGPILAGMGLCEASIQCDRKKNESFFFFTHIPPCP